VVEWLTLKLRILEEPGSNLGPETGWMEIFVVRFSPSRQMLGYCLKLGHIVSFHMLSNSSFTQIILFFDNIV
jgi:hypothetical protein